MFPGMNFDETVAPAATSLPYNIASKNLKKD
jgi:hypothetical protein